MAMHTLTEENYLKTIYKLGGAGEASVTTNRISEVINTRASSVTDMLKRLAEKQLIHYVRYQGVTLTEKGKSEALTIIRKHRLWEVFLVDKLKFKWDEVHDIAEELEHVQSDLLIERLDDYLGNPKVDPHGDLIPDKQGRFHRQNFVQISEMLTEQQGTISGVNEHSPQFLQFLEKTGLTLGKKIQVEEIIGFDSSVVVRLDGRTVTISRDVAKNILIVL